MHALGQLHEQAGNWFNALEMLNREATLVGALPEAVELHFRMGKINEEMLMELPAAQENYAQALDIEPSYTPAIRSLAHDLPEGAELAGGHPAHRAGGGAHR